MATSLQRMLEEHTYFAVIYMLWQQDDVWSEYGPHVFEEVPFMLRSTVSCMVRSGIVRDLHGQVRTCPLSPPSLSLQGAVSRQYLGNMVQIIVMTSTPHPWVISSPYMW